MPNPKDRKINVGNTTLAILNGTEDLSIWSEEELIRGQRRASNGRWMGRKPNVVPKAIHDELVKRKMTKAYDLLNESIYDAVAVLVDVAQDKSADAQVRIKAATEILNRTMGKPTERMQLAVTAEFDRVVESVVVERADVLDVEGWENEGE